MTDDRFLEQLAEDAQQLRYEPADGAMWTRLQARVRERIAAQPTPSDMLARWFRPVATMLAALSIIAALSVRWIEQTQQPATVESMASATAPAPDFGETLGVE